MPKVPVAGLWLLCAALALSPVASAAQDLNIEMKRNPNPNGPILCNVKFSNKTPSKGEAERFAQVGMQMCMRSQPSHDIMAVLLQNGRPIDPAIFAGTLFYDHKSGSVRRVYPAQRGPAPK